MADIERVVAAITDAHREDERNRFALKNGLRAGAGVFFADPSKNCVAVFEK